MADLIGSKHQGAGGRTADGNAIGLPLVAHDQGARAVWVGQGVARCQGLPLSCRAADRDGAGGGIVGVADHCRRTAADTLGSAAAVGVAGFDRDGLAHLCLRQQQGAPGGTGNGGVVGKPLVADAGQRAGAIRVSQGVADGEGLALGGSAAEGDAAAWSLIGVADGDGEALAVAGALAVADLHGDFIDVVGVCIARGFKVGGAGKAKCAGAGVDAELGCIGPAQAPAQGVAVGIAGCHGEDGGGVFCQAQAGGIGAGVAGDDGVMVDRRRWLGWCRWLGWRRWWWRNRGFIDIDEAQGVAGAHCAAAIDAAVLHVDGERVAGLGLKVEHGADFEVQRGAVNFKAGGICAAEGDVVAAQGIVGDGDVGHLDAAGGGRVLRQAGGAVD